MKRKLVAVIAILVLILSGCIPTLERGAEDDIIIVEETEEEEERQYVITPTIDTPENYYRNVLHDGRYFRSEARGTVAPYTNNRLDLNQFELGLMEIATSIYDNEKYFFQEGQFLTGDQINRWLRRYDPDVERNKEGLNPPVGKGDTDEERLRNSPIVLSHIMEHNYLYGSEEEGVHLGGVVIGLSLQSVYYFRTEDESGAYYFHEEPLDLKEVEKQGKEIAQELLLRLREIPGLEEVPITLALYQEQPRGSIIPGSFISMTTVDKGESTIEEWEDIDEQFLIFPSSEARETYPNIANNFNEFTEDVEEFFGTTVGVVGKARVKADMIEELVIELNLQSHGKAEIIALTQFISSRLNNTFANQFPVYIYVQSINGPESVIVQYPDQEPFIHIYKN